VRAALNGAGAFRDVRLRSSFVPSQITGRILGRGRKRLDLAIAVDGLIAATAPTFHVRGAPAASFSAMVPESAFREGRNELEVLAIVGGGSGLRLRSLARAPM
jgi:hypothetical protein